MKITTRTAALFVRQRASSQQMDEDDSLELEVTRWNFLLDDLGIAGLPPEAWVEMFLTPLTSLGGQRVADVLREQLGLDPID
jgi:hypothetical protein